MVRNERIRLALGRFGARGTELWTDFAVLLVLAYVVLARFVTLNAIFVLINL